MRSWLLLLFALGAGLNSASAQAPRYLGNDDCRSCHDRGTAALQFGNHIPAYYIWAQEEDPDRIDRHHRAFLDLIPDERQNPEHGALSKHIAQLMGLRVDLSPGEEWEALVGTWEKCIRCHQMNVTPDQIAPAGTSGRPFDPAEDNIGCEACHGPAEHYRDTHYVLREGETLEARRSRNITSGMKDLKNLEERARLCLGCHTGLDHEIVAAGHPDLAFELYDYSLREPPHWDVRDNSPLAAWAIGQAVAVEKTLRDLAADADLYMPIPAFESENCYACHHKLPYDRWRQIEGHDSVYQVLLASLAMQDSQQSLAKKFQAMAGEIGSNDPAARGRLKARATEAALVASSIVVDISAALSTRQFDPEYVQQLSWRLAVPLDTAGRRWTPEIPSSWVIRNFNQAQQIYWAVSALAIDHPIWLAEREKAAARAHPGLDGALDELWRSGVGYHSTLARKQRFDPRRFNEALKKIDQMVGGMP